MTFDLPALAAILAVVGYSLNDTVVVFDRIRERFVLTRKGTPEEIIDLAINETLSRTLMTSVTTLIAVVFAAPDRRRHAARLLGWPSPSACSWAPTRRSTSRVRSRST